MSPALAQTSGLTSGMASGRHGQVQSLGWALAMGLVVNVAIFVLLPLLAGRMEPVRRVPELARVVRITEVEPPRPEQRRPEQRRMDEPPPLERPEARRPETPAPQTPSLDLRLDIPKLAVDVPTAAVPVAVAPAPEVPPAPAPRGFELSQVDAAPRLLHSVPPDYPFSARSRNIQGTVTVRFLVDESGRVEDPTVMEADPPGVFDASVLKAVRRWRFAPGKRHGEPVATWVELPVRFDLSG